MKSSMALAAFVAEASPRLLELAGPAAREREEVAARAAQVLRGQLHDAVRQVLGPEPEIVKTTEPANPLDADALAALLDASLEAAVVELKPPPDMAERIGPPDAREEFLAAFTDARASAIEAGRAAAAERLRALAGDRS